MKKILINSIASMLIGLLFIAAIASSFVALIPDNQSSEEEAMDYQSVSQFDVTGVMIDDTVKLTFKNKKTGYSITGIEFQVDNTAGTVTAYAKMPKITGSREKKVWQFLLRNGFTPEGAAGIMANIEHESGFQPTIIGDSGTSYGIMQWHAGRKDRVREWIKNRGIDPDVDSDELLLAQLEYAIQEPGYQDTIDKVKYATSPTDAAKTWCTDYEVPENKYAKAASRAASAQGHYSAYKDIPAYDVEENSEKDSEASEEVVALTGKYQIADAKASEYESRPNKGVPFSVPFSMLTFEGKLAVQSCGFVLWVLSGPALGHYVKEYFEENDREALAYYTGQKTAAIIRGVALVGEATERSVSTASEVISKMLQETVNSTLHVPFGGGTTASVYTSWTSFYGERAWNSCIWHHGVDLVGEGGMIPIYSVLAGDVVAAGWNGGYGRSVTIESTNPWSGTKVTYQYNHLSAISVEKGQMVLAGTQIGNQGTSGSSGDGAYPLHLHLNYYLEGEEWNPRNSAVWKKINAVPVWTELNLDLCNKAYGTPWACKSTCPNGCS